MMLHQRPVWLAGSVLVWLLVQPAACSLAQAPRVLQVDLEQSSLFGLPVHWDLRTAALLEADGQFHLLPVEEIRGTRILKKEFRPESLTSARSRLQAELGQAYETLIAGPYVLAAPAGNSKRWKSRFTALLAGYLRYFEVRGWPVRPPDFPLVVIVFQSRQEFQKYVIQSGTRLPPQAVGGYLRASNRCVLFEIPGYGGTDWDETEATIVHEAVHQLAFNTGIHERLFENPLWFVEGLATMFEVPSVYDLNLHRSDLSTRMNRSQLRLMREIAQDSQLTTAHIRSLIATDDLFRSNPQVAYALSWGLTFYLAERMPNDYRRFIELQSQKGFGIYSQADRERDFVRIFSTTPSSLAVQLGRLFAADSS